MMSEPIADIAVIKPVAAAAPTPPPAPEPVRFVSKKERKLKKEEARRAKLQQERDSALAVRLLENELYEY